MGPTPTTAPDNSSMSPATTYSAPGHKRTSRTILRVFNWPNLHIEVREYVRPCAVCLRLRPNLLEEHLPHSHDPVSGPFSALHIDFWHCTYQGRQHNVLTMLDNSTKWAEAEPMPDAKTTTVASALIRCWITRFGVPRRLICDNEATFVSSVLNTLAAHLGIQKPSILTYRPQSNSPVEAFHKGLNKRFAVLSAGECSLPFPEALALALFGYRATMHTATQHSPAFLTYGRDPMPGSDHDWRFIKDTATQARVQFLNLVRQDILDRTQQARVYQALKRQEVTDKLEVGDLVVLRLNPYQLAKRAQKTATAAKLVPKWSIPYRVLGISSNGARVRVQSVLEWDIREVHRSEAHVISKPQDDHQVVEWEKQIAHEAELDDRFADLTPKLKQDKVRAAMNFLQPAKRRRAEVPGEPVVRSRRRRTRNWNSSF